MGLDISAYYNPQIISKAEYNGLSEDDREEYSELYFNRDFAEQFPEALCGRYYRWENIESESRFGFRAGSYGGYSAFRRLLSKAVLGCDVSQLWDQISQYGYPSGPAAAPFVYMLNFTDCDGIISKELSVQLAKDFVDNDAKFKAYLAANSDPTNVEWYGKVYDNFANAFRLVAESSNPDAFVKFH